MTYSGFDITPTPRKWVGSFPTAIADRVRSDKTAHARRVQEILECLGGGAGGGGFASRGMRAASRFDPKKISGCAMHFDAANPAAYTLSGSTTTNIYNLANGIAWNTGQSTMPDYSATGLNGRPTFIFDAAKSVITTTDTSVISALSNDNANTVFLVWVTNVGATKVMLSSGLSGTTRPYKLYLQASPGGLGFETIGDSGGSDQFLVVYGVVSTATPYVAEFTDSGSSGSAYLNGTTIFAAQAYTAGAPKTMTRVAFGSWGGGYHVSGAMAAAVLHSRVLSAAERSYIRVGLGNRWAITVTA